METIESTQVLFKGVCFCFSSYCCFGYSYHKSLQILALMYFISWKWSLHLIFKTRCTTRYNQNILFTELESKASFLFQSRNKVQSADNFKEHCINGCMIPAISMPIILYFICGYRLNGGELAKQMCPIKALYSHYKLLWFLKMLYNGSMKKTHVNSLVLHNSLIKCEPEDQRIFTCKSQV